MHSLWLGLTAVTLLGAPAPPDDPAARADATLRQMVKLPPEQQRAWLRRVEARLVRASRLTMKREEAEQEQARVAALLHQKTIPWQALVDLLKLLDQREKAAIARMVRHYRSQVYETFAKQQQTLVERQEAWYRVWLAWEAAGRHPEQQDLLMDWLVAAIRNSMPDSIRPLPSDPKFQHGEEMGPGPLAKPAEDKPKPAPKEQVAQPVKQAPQPQPKESVAEDSRPLMTKGAAAAPTPLPDPILPSARRGLNAGRVRASRHADAIAADLPLSENVPPAEVPPQRVAPWGVAMTVRPAPLPSMASLPPALPPGIERAARSDRSTVSSGPAAAKTGLPGDTPRVAARKGSELPKVRPPQVRLAERSANWPPEKVVPPRQPAPVSPPLDAKSSPRHAWHDPVATLPKVSKEPAVQETVAMVAPPAANPSKPRAAQAANPTAPREDQAQVNLKELTARIAGVNLNLQTLEAELDERRPWSVDQLDALLNRLDILVLRQKDLTLFSGLITPQEQARVGRIVSPKQAIARLAARIVEVRNRLRSDDSKASEQERQATLKHLDGLSDRLANLAAEK